MGPAVLGVLAGIAVLVVLVGPMVFASRRVEKDLMQHRPEGRRLVWAQVIFVAAAILGALVLLVVIGRL